MHSENLTIAVLFTGDTVRPEILEIIAALPHLDLIGQSVEPEDLLESLTELPDLILLELPGKDPTLEWLDRLQTGLAQTVLIAYSAEWDPDILIRTMQAGVRDFLTLPFSETDLMASIERVFPAKKWGHIIAVTGDKGGIGITTIAVNLAVALEDLTKDQIALVDLGRPFPDIGKFLDQKPTYSLSDLIRSREQFDKDFLKKIMQPFSPRIEILHGAEDFGHQNELDIDLIGNILAELRLMYKYIIVDLGNWIDTLFMKVITEAEMVILLTGLSVIELHNIKLLWSLLDDGDQSIDKIKIIANRYNKGDSVQLKYLREITHSSPLETLPSGYLSLMDALNEGKPLGMVAPRSKLWQKIRNLAELVQRQVETIPGAGPGDKAPSKRRFWVF